MPEPKPWIVEIAQEHYRYGLGLLRLRVERVDTDPRHSQTYEGEIWIPVEGVQLTKDGAEVKRRSVLVRKRSLPPRPA